MAAPLELEEAVRRAGYRIVGPPIRGGMSTVYPAQHPSSAGSQLADIAIKVLHDTADVGRLRREAELLGSVNHPAIARFVEVGELDTGAAFLASAWVRGSTMHAELVDQGRFGIEEATAIFESFAGGLQHLHDRGIVHRDLSPNNVILGPNAARATLIDFGISRGADSAYQTIGTDLAGTPRYLAPEVISGSDPTPASDQYAAAILLHEMLTGTWPYPESPTAANALHHQLSTAPTPLIETLSDAPPSLDQAIQRALRKDPADRFASMDDFVAALYGSAGDPVHPTSKRRGRAAVAVAVAGIAVAGIAGALILSRDDGESATPPTSIVPARSSGGEWAAGDAAALACNMLEFVDFDDQVLPRNWYLNPIEEAGIDVIATGGQDNTPALRIGLADRYGLWGEEVPVEPGETYVFAGTFITNETPAAANFTIEWYDADNTGLLIDTRTVDLTQVADGRVSLTSTAPANARFAVTRVFKDSSVGSLLADEFVLANANDPCVEQL